MMLIAIDHGNKQVKTVHRTFTSGLTDSATRPAFGEDVLQYQGRYYALSNQRIPYMRDKTEDGKFFLLTLFGIAYEIEAAKCYTKDDILDVQLAVGLPPAHFGAQAERFQDYFLGRDILEFSFRDKPFSIYISETVCFPQAYAAAIPMLNRLLEVPKAYVIDIGGFTADYLLLHKGKGELSVCDSLENGVILLYNQIRSKVNATYGLPLEEADIDALLQGEDAAYPAEVAQVATAAAQAFITDLFGKLRERGIDLRIAKAIFVGGGSILLRKQIEVSGKAGDALFVEDMAANARGYEILYRASKLGR